MKVVEIMGRHSFRCVSLNCLGLVAFVVTSAASAQSGASPYTHGTRYDAMNRVTGTIAPDPDGGGPLGHPATRTTYDAAGRPIRQETGELAQWQSEAVAPVGWSGFTPLSSVETTYDALDRKLTETTKGSDGNPVSLVQYSYDAAGRLECTAQRMNPAAWGSLPASACSLGTEGSFGPDRITRSEYDAANQLLKVQKAYGTALQQDYATYTYSLNGKQTSLTDARGYRAEMTWDGFDRQARWTFPSATTPGVVNPGDYEEYGYDANGNRTSLRKRDGSTLTYQYDALNRNIAKIVPERAGLDAAFTRDVYYGYDLRGLQTYARFDGPSGEGVATSYDGFGRATSSSLTMDGVTRTLQYAHDRNGNRTELTQPDVATNTYAYDGLDRLTTIYQDAWTTSIVGYSYNSRGLRAGQTGRAGQMAAFGYDPAGRLNALSHDLAGDTRDVAFGFAYNPASQVAQQTRSNDAYVWSGYVNVDRGYAVNGLNQYTSAGATSFGYDANGNLTSEGATSYVYDVENRLVGAGGNANVKLRYDPLGRLYEVTASNGTVTRFLHDGDELVAEYDGSGNLTQRFVHGQSVDDPVVWYEGGRLDSPRWLHADRQGSIIAISDGVGAEPRINSYDEYGNPPADMQGNKHYGRFGYTGQVWIPELGLWYYKARFYSSSLGRFLQVDPIGYDDQVNLYAYVGNDPLNKIDPMGMETGSVAYNSIVSLTEAAKKNPPPDWAYQAAKYVPLTGPAIRLMELILVPPQPGTPPVPGRAPRIKDPCCFVAGTLVDTERGLRRIEEIKVGDLVWSRNPVTGETALKPVIDVIPRHDREIWTVRLKGAAGTPEAFDTTEEHPWWVVGKGWTETASLQAGMILITRDNRELAVASVDKTGRLDGTYNLTVGDFETYFVGASRVLVHNCSRRTKHTDNRHFDRSKYPDKGKFIKPNQADKLSERTEKSPDRVEVQGDRTRYEKDFGRDIGTQGERTNVTVTDRQGKRVTQFPRKDSE